MANINSDNSKTDESNTVITTTQNELDKTYDGYEVVDVNQHLTIKLLQLLNIQ